MMVSVQHLRWFYSVLLVQQMCGVPPLIYVLIIVCLRSPGVGVWPLTRGLVGYIIAPTFATFTLSFDNCLPKL